MSVDARKTSQSDVLARLRTDLVTGEFRPGDQIVQEALAEKYGVSRIPLREALKVLEAEGQVVHHPNRGHFVAELSIEDLIEVYRLRTLLEAEAIREAVPTLTDADVAALTELVDDINDAAVAQDVLAMTAANRRFHFAIFDAARLPRLSRLLHQLWDATEAYRALYYREPANRALASAEHNQMIAAVTAGDAAMVIALHNEHREHSVKNVRRLLESPY